MRILSLMVAIYTVVLSGLSLVRHHFLLTAGFDLGIHDQGLWLLRQGLSDFTTIRGLPLTVDHFQPLAVPLSWLYLLPYPLELLLTFQSLVFAMGGVAVHGLARLKGFSERACLVTACVYLLNPVLWKVNLFDFHVNALALTPLLFAVYFLESERPVPYVVSLLAALACGEAIGLQVVFLSLNAALLRSWRWGAGTLLLGLAFLGLMAGRSSAYLGLYAHLGAGPGEILWTLVSRPIDTLNFFLQPDILHSAAYLLVPLAGLPLLSPVRWFPALPVMAGNVLAWRQSQHTVDYHYTATLLPFLFWAAVAGGALLRERKPGFRLAVPLGWCFTVSLCLNLANSEWLRGPHPLVALPEIPVEASLSADNLLLPHYSQRVEAYMFPNPFSRVAWGSGVGPLVEQTHKEARPRSPAQLRRAVESTDIDTVLLLKDEVTWPLFPADRQLLVAEILRGGLFEKTELQGAVLLRRCVPVEPWTNPELALTMDAAGRSAVFEEEISGIRRLFWVDLQNGEVQALMSQANGDCYDPYLSGDGRYLVFCSRADNLVAGDRNAVADLFRLDLREGGLVRVAPPQRGGGKGSCFLPALDRGGDNVVFYSQALGWDWGRGVFKYCYSNGSLQRLDKESLPMGMTRPRISPDGTTCAWTEMTAGPEPLSSPRLWSKKSGDKLGILADRWDPVLNSHRDLYVSQGTPRLLVDAEGRGWLKGLNGSEPDDDCWEPSLSEDGRYLVFTSYANNLVDGDNNGVCDVFLHDFRQGLTRRVSLGEEGQPADGPSYSPQISADGRTVLFVSHATNLAERAGRLYLWREGRCRVVR